MTPAERRLWKHLRRRQVDGWRWRRQYSVGAYVLDFFCPAASLGIELDGDVHRDPSRAVYDTERERWLEEVAGVRRIRFENREVMGRVEVVVEATRAAIASDSQGRASRPDRTNQEPRGPA